MASSIGSIGTLGTDPNYGAFGVQHDPRLLMAQKLMEVEKMPTNNSTQSSFWANLLNQGARGALGGYLYNDVKTDREKERVKQEAEAKDFREMMERGPPGSAPNGSLGRSGGTGTATAPSGATRVPPQAALGGPGVIPEAQRHEIVNQAVSGTMVPPELAHAVITQESNWKPGARGKGSDTGLGQVTSSTAADPGYGLPPLSDADRLDPAKNAAWSMRYLEARGKAAGLTRPEDWQNPAKVALALKAYNGNGDPNYVANVTRHLRTSDASPPPGSNLEALLSGVDAAKPRNLQLAERVALGGAGGTATDSPTPILSAPVVPVASAALQGAPGPQPPSATVPQPPPASVPAPPSATVPQPEMATVPQPEPAVVPQPEMATVPPPIANMDPATLASINGAPQPEPAVVPQPEPATVPAAQPSAETAPVGSGETGGQPTVLPQEQPPAATAPAGSGETGGQPTALPQEEPPLPVPPVPPRPSGSVGPAVLAQRLVGGGGPNATEALNTASLAAARRGENFSPGAGPNGQQLAAPLMSWAGNLGADGAPVLTPQPDGSSGQPAGPTGAQLAAPLQQSQQGAPPVTPASGPSGGDPGATGGQSKWPDTNGAAPAQHAPQADAQAQADWFLSMARQAAGSSNPKIRAQAGVLEAQGTALQRRIDRQDLLNQQLDARRDAHQQALDGRNLPIHDLTFADGKVHSVQVMPDGSQRDLGLSGNQHTQPDKNSETKDVLVGNDVHIFERDRNSGTWKDTGLLSGNQRTQPDKNPQHITVKVDGKNYVHTWNPDTGKYENTGLLAEKQDDAADPNAAPDFSKNPLGTAYTVLQTLAEQEAKGPLTPRQIASRETARKIILQHAQTVPTGAGVSVTTPPMPDYSQAYPPPGGAPAPAPASPAGTQTGPNTVHIPNPAQPAPPAEVEKMLDGTNSLRNTGLALRSLQENPDAVGPMKRIFPNLQQWMDPKGAITQAAVDDIGSQLLHARSGAAISQQEFDRLSRFVPSAGDPYEVSMVKIQRLHRAYGDMLANRYSVYGPGNKATPYQAIPDVEDAINEFRYPSVPKGRDARQTETMLDSGATYTLPASLGGGHAKWNAGTHHFDPIQEGK